MIVNRQYGAAHYVGLSLKTVLGYAVFIAALFSVPALQWAVAQIEEGQIERGVIGETAITIEIADTDIKRVNGLGNRESIPKNHSMLFIFDTSGYHAIWMKDMRFNLDIIWLNDFSEVTSIKRNATPESFPNVFKPGKPAKYVLEFNAGFAKRNSIRIGDRFVLP